MAQRIPIDMFDLPEIPVAPKLEPDNLTTRLELALETSQIGVWDFNWDSGELICDERMQQLFFHDLQAGELAYHDWENAIHPEDLDRAKFELVNALERQERLHSEYRIQNGSGKIRHIRSIGSLYKDQSGQRHMVGVNWDVTGDVDRTNELKQMRLKVEKRNNELHEAKARLQQIAQHDALTGLPNRRYLEEILEAHVSNPINAVLLVDLDGFKQINDTMGHAAGDALLKGVSEILRDNVRPSDFVARVGGDEFVILCLEEVSPDALEKLAAAIISDVQKPFNHNQDRCRVGTSIGILAHAHLVEDPDTLLLNADLAMYEAKRRGRNRYELFADKLRILQDEKKQVSDEIMIAIERCDFVPFYQPQFCAKSKQLVGLEVLARWRHSEKGILPPAGFLDIATELGVASQIDRIILHRALFDVTRWRAKGISVPKISVNVSPTRLSDPDLIDELEQLCCRSHNLSFELVESIFLDDADETILANIEKIRAMGIGLEVDDFGTAYTSLLSILKIRPARLKIDRQLVGPAIDCESTRRVIRSIIDISNLLHIETVAEGIETAGHIQLMTDLGCDILQGYALGYPVPAADYQNLFVSNLEATG